MFENENNLFVQPTLEGAGGKLNISFSYKQFIWNINCPTSGILRDKTMDNKLMYIPYDYKQNYLFFRKFEHC